MRFVDKTSSGELKDHYFFVEDIQPLKETGGPAPLHGGNVAVGLDKSPVGLFAGFSGSGPPPLLQTAQEVTLHL